MKTLKNNKRRAFQGRASSLTIITTSLLVLLVATILYIISPQLRNTFLGYEGGGPGTDCPSPIAGGGEGFPNPNCTPTPGDGAPPPTFIATSTPSPTASVTSSVTVTATPPRETTTPSPTASVTATATRSASPTPNKTRTPTPSPSPCPSPDEGSYDGTVSDSCGTLSIQLLFRVPERKGRGTGADPYRIVYDQAKEFTINGKDQNGIQQLKARFFCDESPFVFDKNIDVKGMASVNLGTDLIGCGKENVKAKIIGYLDGQGLPIVGTKADPIHFGDYAYKDKLGRLTRIYKGFDRSEGGVNP